MKDIKFIWFIALTKVVGAELNGVTDRRVILAKSKFGAYRQAIKSVAQSNNRGANLKLVNVIDAPHLN